MTYSKEIRTSPEAIQYVRLKVNTVGKTRTPDKVRRRWEDMNRTKEKLAIIKRGNKTGGPVGENPFSSIEQQVRAVTCTQARHSAIVARNRQMVSAASGLGPSILPQ